MPLVSTSDFEGLPTEPIARWLKLRDLIEQRFESAENFDREVGTSTLFEYVEVLSSAADELGVGSLPEVSYGNIREEIDLFRGKVASLATRLNLKLPGASTSTSVALQNPSKKKIYDQIERLRKIVLAESSLSEKQRELLFAKLDELHQLVFSPRTDFTKVMTVLAYIGGAVLGVTTFLAELPDAIGTITSLIGADKVEEDEVRSLEAPNSPLQLPPPAQEIPPSDDLPF